MHYDNMKKIKVDKKLKKEMIKKQGIKEEWRYFVIASFFTSFVYKGCTKEILFLSALVNLETPSISNFEKTLKSLITIGKLLKYYLLLNEP